MRAVVQRVRRASVSVAGECVGKIERGLLLLIGIEPSDAQSDIDYIVKKCTQLRIFEDADGKMNLSAVELGYEILLISQFTLFGDARKATARVLLLPLVPKRRSPFTKSSSTLFALSCTPKRVFSARICRLSLSTTVRSRSCWTAKKCFNFAIFSLCLKRRKAA